MKRHNKKGFTLVELVIVIAVIAVLAAVLIPTFTSVLKNAEKSAAMQQIAASYKEALANALIDDGEIHDGDSETVNGFTFEFANNGANASVTVPQDFAFSVVSIQNGIVVFGDNPVDNPVISVTGITLNESVLNLTVGQNSTLTATVAPDNATDKTVVWTTSNPSAATVDNGTVTAVGAGNATITASSGGYSAVCEVNVTLNVLYAIGDSITNGSGGSERWTIQSGWLKYVVTEANGFDTTNSKNLGISGLGFVHADQNFHLTARDIIEKSEALSTSGTGTGYGTGYVANTFGDYNVANADIITVAIGINDWKDGNVMVNEYMDEMEYCLTKIRELNSTCEVYYILPFNTSVVGNYDSNYSFGSKGDNNANRCYGNTLSEFREMIRESLINGNLKDLNIKIIDIEGLSRDELQKYKNNDPNRITNDGLHPNNEGYSIIGTELSNIIKSLLAGE